MSEIDKIDVSLPEIQGTEIVFKDSVGKPNAIAARAMLCDLILESTTVLGFEKLMGAN